jgi:hypothetical protein
LVGKILDKRYVVLEEVGADGAGFRYLVYDMNTLRRLHLRVDPDGNGQLSGNTYAVVEMNAPLAPAKQAAPAAVPAAARERRTSPAATPRPRTPTPKGFAPTTKPAEEPKEKPAKAVAQTVPDEGDKDSVPIPRLDALPSKTAPQEPALLRKPKATPVPPGLEEKPLEQALERALTDAKPAAEPAAEAKDPFNTTQPIDLASAEEIAQDAQAQPPEPAKQDQRQSGERPRIQTKVLEAAWFAQGDQLEEEEEHTEEVEAHRPVDHDQLERQAAELSPDEYRKYALDLPPPMPPPVRIVEAFLGAKPDVVARLVDQQEGRVAQPAKPEPARAEPPQGASPFQIATPPKAEPTPPPKVEPTPPPKVEVAPPPKVELAPPPKVELAPPPKVELAPPKVEVALRPKVTTPPPKVEATPPPEPIVPPPKVELTPPPKVEVAAPLPAEPAPAPAVIPPVDQLLPPEPGLPAPQPPAAAPEPAPLPPPATEPEPFKPPEPLPPTRSAPTFPPPRATALRSSARRPAEQLRRKALETRAGTFLLGLLLGGLVTGGLTCLLTPDAKAPAPPAKVAPAPAPQPVACPKAPPCNCKVATPAPAPAPAEEHGLSLKDKRQLHKYLRLANRAMKRHQWRRARNLASLALKLDPKEPRAQRIKNRAERRLGR